MERHENTIGCAVNVGFEVPEAQVDGVFERGERILRRHAGAAAMSERNDPTVVKEREVFGPRTHRRYGQ